MSATTINPNGSTGSGPLGPTSDTAGGGAAESNNVSTQNAPQKQDLWKFGASTLRIGEDGAVRNATQQEIIAETGSSPAVMVQVLSAGADLLRFDGNGEYREESAAIGALYQQEGKSPEEIAEEVRVATEALRNKMREDVRNGVFTIDDAGRVSHRGVQVPNESIGFELNAILIESLKDRVSDLQSLLSDIQTIDKFIQENIEDNQDELEVLFDIQRQDVVLSRREFGGGKPVIDSSFDEVHGVLRSNRPDLADLAEEMKQFKVDESHETEFDKFIKENFPDSDFETGNHGRGFLEDLDARYRAALEDTGLTPVIFTEDLADGNIKNLPRESVFDHGWDVDRFRSGGTATLKRFEKYTVEPREQIVNREAFTRTSMTQLDAHIDSRIKTVTNLTEQIGTNFKVDNARFNSIIEAMNSYNKSVTDSLRRFSII